VGAQEDRVARLWAEYQPRIDEAKAKDGSDRHRLFLGLLEERIGDFPAIILTIERYLLLGEGVFDSTDKDSRVPVLRFLWIVSPTFKPCPKAAKAFIRKHRDIDPEPYPDLIRDYIERTFHLAPPQKAGRGKDGTAHPAEWISSFVDLIASEYGWTEQDILQTPLPRLFLYLGRIQERTGDGSSSFSTEADRLQDEFMRRANAGRSA